MADRYSNPSGNAGNWDTTATWSTSEGGSTGASIPVDGDRAIIVAGDTVTNNGNHHVGSVEIQSGAILHGDGGAIIYLDDDGNANIFQNDGSVTNTPRLHFTNSSSRNAKFGSGTFGLISVEFSSTATLTMTSALTCGSLSIGSNSTLTTSGSNYALTVTGAIDCAGNLTCNSSAVQCNGLRSTGGTVNLPDGSGSFTIKGTEFSGYGIHDTESSGNLVHNSGTVTWDTGGLSTMNAKSTFNNITTATSSTDLRWFSALTLAGNLTVAANTDVYEHASAGGNLTVGGAVTVSGKLGDSSAYSAYEFGSLTIASGGEYAATSGTTTINGGFHNKGTYTPNGGTIEMSGTGSVVNALVPKLTINNDSALYFSGGNGSATTEKNVVTMGDNDLASTGSLTLSAWVKPQAPADGGTVHGAAIISKQANYNSNVLGYGLYWSHSGQNFYFNIGDGSNGDRLNSAGSLPHDVWYHVVGTYNSTSKDIALWVNGVSVDTGTASSCGDLSASNSNILRLGANGSTATDGDAFFTGYIADVRMYAYAFTEVHVKDTGAKIHVNDPMKDNNYGLTAMWACNEGTSHTIADGHDAGTEYDGAYQRNGSNYSTDIWKTDQFTSTLLPTMTEVDSLEVSSGVLDLDNRNCLHFDGTNDYAIATSTKGDIEWSGQAFTMAGWVYMTDSSKNILMSLVPSTSSNDGAVLVIDEDDSSHNNSIALSFKEYGTSDNDNTAGATAAATLAANTWHHIAVTYNGSGSGTIGNYNFYIDGALFETGKALTSGDFSGRTDTLTANKVYIGRDKTEFFKGKMRDVRLHFNDLSAEQIHSIYLGRYNVTPDHWWKMDEGTGTNINDYGTATESDAIATDFAMSGGASSDWETANFKVNGSARIGTNGSI